MENSLSIKFTVGDFYTKSSLSDLIEEPNLKIVREGLYYCKKSRSTLLFVDLVKKINPKNFILMTNMRESIFIGIVKPLNT